MSNCPKRWLRGDTDAATGSGTTVCGLGEEGGADIFAADKVWLYIALLTIGYMLSRGFAKSGVRDPYWAERGDSNADH